MNARLGMLLLLTIALAAIAAGCGGDDSASSSAASGQREGPTVTTSSLDKAEFIKQAEVACVREGKGTVGRIEAYLNKKASKGLSQDELNTGMFKTVVAPIVEEQIAAVRELGAPAGEEEAVEALLAVQNEAVDEVKEAKSVGGMAEFEHHFVEATKEFEAFGFKGCMIAGWV